MYRCGFTAHGVWWVTVLSTGCAYALSTVETSLKTKLCFGPYCWGKKVFFTVAFQTAKVTTVLHITIPAERECAEIC